MKIRQKVGMVFQNPDNQIVATSVEEDVAFGPENLGARIAQRIESSLKWLERLSIGGPYALRGTEAEGSHSRSNSYGA